MRVAALIICIAALSVAAAQAEQSSCGVCGTRQTHPSDVKLENPPALENGESFSMILYGDPQTYTKNTFSQPIFELMTAWTAAHKNALKIKAVLCTGDIVERNDTLTAFPLTRNDINGDAQSFLQWEAAARAFSRLDGEIPYILCTGNHDYGYESSENRNTYFNDYFPVSKNPLWRDNLVSTFPNAAGIMTLENAAFAFDCGKWGKVLVLSLEFAPRDEVLDWAKKLLESKKYKDSKAIILTHSVLRVKKGLKTSIAESEGYKLQPRNWAAAMMKKLVSDSDNIKLVLCGHSGDPSKMSDDILYENSKGRKIPVVMFNPQAVGGWNGNGGDGWLRIMEFMPDGKTISMRTYSPLFAASAKTQHLSWNRDSDNEFKIEIE